MILFLRFLDVFLHLDRVLGDVISRFGVWSYALIFLVIFCETGLVVTPFLPGDSLLFAAGTFAALGSFNIIWLLILLGLAAILGDSVNFLIGRKLGMSFFATSRAAFLRLRPAHIEKTRRFFERHGGKTIIFARFVPIVRTFAPFVAGVGDMRYERFLAYNVIGGVTWVGLFTLGGYLFGNLPSVRENFTLVIFAIIGISVLPGVIGYLRERFSSTSKT